MEELQKKTNELRFAKVKGELCLYNEKELWDFSAVIRGLQHKLDVMFMLSLDEQAECFFELKSLVKESSCPSSHWTGRTINGVSVFVSYRRGVLLAEILHPDTANYKTIYIEHIGDRDSFDMSTEDMVRHIGFILLGKKGD